MKRILIIVLLILVIILGLWFVLAGVQIGDFQIASVKEIDEASSDMTVVVAAYNKLNDDTYVTMIDTLDSAVSSYETSKAQYEDLIAELVKNDVVKNTDDALSSSAISMYEIDFLWTRIGNYAKQEGLTINMSVSKAVSSSNLGYDFYNLNFEVDGEYIGIASFLYDLEDDDELGFEIRDFQMTSKHATFTIYNVPLDSSTLIDVEEEVDDEVYDITDITQDIEDYDVDIEEIEIY